MKTYKEQIENINEIIILESIYIIAHATNRQFKNELNEYTICLIKQYIKRCKQGYKDNIIEIYKKHINEKEKEYTSKYNYN